MRRTYAAALALLLLALAPTSAAACWDGIAATHGSVALSERCQECTPAWSVEVVRTCAQWLRRFEALLPAGSSLELDHRWVTLHCPAASHDSASSPGAMPALFDWVATQCRVPAARWARALATTAPVYTVQVLATASPLRAQEAARAIDAAARGAHGFIEVGGFPASNPTAHVVSACGVHRVVVGAFLDRGRAAALAASLGSGAWVRPL